MELIKSFVLSSHFVIYVLLVILTGILVSEYFKRTRKERGGILSFITILILVIILAVINTYKTLSGLLIFTNLIIILNILIFGLLSITSYRFWKKINKKIFFSIFVLIFCVILLLVFPNSLFKILNPILLITAVTLFYFFIIDFLIKTSGGKSRQKKIRKKKKIFHWKLLLIGIVIGIILSGIFIVGIFQDKEYVSPELSGELNIYNWEEYFDEGDALLNDFEKEFGVKVNLYEFTTEEELLDAVENYEGIYDLVVSLDASFEELIADDKLEMLDMKNIPNIKNIDKKFKFTHNQNFDYGVPFLWGTTGLAINTKYIPEDTNSWEILWNSKYEGRVGILFNEIELFSLGARYVGVPLVPSKISDLQKINDFLKLQKELVGGYMNSYDIIDEMINESLWVSVTWNVDAGMMADENPNIKYILPKEGTMMWIEHMVIPKGASNKENAEVFINFIHRPEIYARIANYQWSPGVNIPAREFIDEEIMSDETLNIPEDKFHKLEDYYKFSHSQEILDARHEMWEELIK
jgi:spermidine/putrescine transport system substrate-binding protein